MYSNISVTKQRVFLSLLIIAVIATAVAAFISKPVSAAGGSCTSWVNTGTCCETWWPGQQDTQSRYCSFCDSSGCHSWTEYRCKDLTQCP